MLLLTYDLSHFAVEPMGFELMKGPDSFYYFTAFGSRDFRECSKICSGQFPGFRLTQVKTKASIDFIRMCKEL